ncbi:MAG: hypothetical protein JWQ32_1158 [Marmoricola sp.]|nr:hypothetical protein [Marmoricola sp.]
MPTSEGQGIARTAWLAYVGAVNKVTGPAIMKVAGPAVTQIAAGQIVDLVGFWVVWHLHGGFEGLQDLGMSRASIFRKIAKFRRVFHVHPDEFTLEGVTLDVEAYLKAYSKEV